MQIADEIEVLFFMKKNNRVPFEDWLGSLKDVLAKKAIFARLARLRGGNFGIHKNVGEGVEELKIDFGAGYRIYFYRTTLDQVLILCAGDKSLQKRDIEQAKLFKSIYLREMKYAGKKL